MSYSNGKLPEDTFSHEKIIEIVKGLPGVGFKLTDAGDYDMQNKKLRNVASPQTNNDATTKSYVDVGFSKTLKKDGTDQMNGLLDMNYNRIENVGNGRHGTTDALTHIQFEAFYFDLNTDSGDIEAQNPINMKNERILGVKDPILHSDASNKFYVDSSLNFKADKTELANCLKKDGSIALTNNLDLGNNKIVNVKEATSGTDVVNFTQLNNELYKYLHKSGGDMTGDIRMNNHRIYGIGNVENDTSAVNRKYVNDELDKKLDKNKDFSMGNNKITSLRNPDDSNELVNKSYVDQKVSQAGGSVDLTPYLKRDGTVSVTGNLNMSLNKIINCGQPTGTRDVTNKAYVDSEVGKKPDTNQVILRDGSNTMTSVLDMNNQRIINLGNATHNQDAITLKQVNDGIATVSTENNKYTDQQIAKSHISTHTNRKNVLSYAMDDGEFTEGVGIQDAKLIDFDDMPHKINKKAFSMKVWRTTDGSDEFKGRFDFNLFKMYRDNKSDKYTVCVETYFQKSPFYSYEFASTLLGFEKLNMNIDSGTTIKVNSEYKYLRTILNLSPDGDSPSIQRRLYVNFKSNFDNNSPHLLPVFVLIYGIKGEAKNDLDMTIYDYEKAYEVANNKFELHIPLEMNNNKITGLSAPIGNNDAVTKKYLTDSVLPSYIWGITSTNNASCDFLTPYGDFVLKIGEMFIGSIKIFSQFNYSFQSNHSLVIQTNVSSIYNINFAFNKTITININRYFRNINYIRINFSDRKNKSFMFLIQYKTFSL